MFGLTNEETLAVLNGHKRVSIAFRILGYVSESGTAIAHECADALRVPNQSLTTRFSELVRSGCLISCNTKRRTKTGGLAGVFKVSETADFKNYLATINVKAKKKRTGITQMEEQILAAGLEFLSQWRRARTKKARQAASVRLITELSALSSRSRKSCPSRL